MRIISSNIVYFRLISLNLSVSGWKLANSLYTENGLEIELKKKSISVIGEFFEMWEKLLKHFPCTPLSGDHPEWSSFAFVDLFEIESEIKSNI